MEEKGALRRADLKTSAEIDSTPKLLQAEQHPRDESVLAECSQELKTLQHVTLHGKGPAKAT